MHDLTIQLKLARMRMQITQNDVAKKIGLTLTSYSNYENHIESIKRGSLNKFLLICQSLDDEFRAKIINEKFLLTLLED